MTAIHSVPAKPPNAADIIAHHLGFINDDQAKWWNLIGHAIGVLLQVARTEPHEQYQALLFAYKAILPALGPYPCRFPSALGMHGNLFEPSLNFQRGGAKTVRFCFEPASLDSGTPSDVANTKAVTRFVEELGRLGLKDWDARLFEHFAKAFSITEEEAQVAVQSLCEKPISKSSGLFAFDIKRRNVQPKGYAIGLLKNLISPETAATRLYDSLQDLAAEMDCTKALEEAYQAIRETTGSTDLKLVSWDYVPLSKTRVKIYNYFENATLAEFKDIWTGVGRWNVPGAEEGFELFARLWIMLADAREECRDASDPAASQTLKMPLLTGYNYELTQGCQFPQFKAYLQVHDINDLVLAETLGRFLYAVGCVERVDEPTEILRQLFPHEDLSQSTELQYILLFAYTPEGGPYLSIYYRPVVR